MGDKLSVRTAVSRTWKAASSKSGVARKELGTGLLLVVLCIVVTILDPRFLGGANLQNMARLIGAFGIFSIGVGVVIISSGIDLSVGSIFALLGVLLSMMLTQGRWPGVLAVTAVMAIAMVIGLAHGLLVSRVRLQPLSTLCGLLLYRGLARFIAGDETKGFGNAEGFEGLRTLATGSVLGVPTPFLLLMIVSFVMWVVVHRSVYGRHLFAVGRNEEAARYSGINSSLVTACAYVISGLLAGVASVVFAFYTNSISPSTHGSFYELYGIAAAVLGGCSLRGGEGSIAGILIGTALLQVLQNLVNLLGVPSSLNFAVMGAVILIGAIVDEILKRRAAKPASRKVETSPESTGSQRA
jgi:ribose transport system permease protein